MIRASEPLTLPEHRELARELRTADLRLRELSNTIASIYGAESRAAFSFLRAAESLERLRREMQTQALLDWPEAASERLYT